MTAAEAVPDPETLAIVKAVLPQPTVVGVARLDLTKLGKVTVMLSFISKATFIFKPNVIEDSFDDTGLETDNSERILAVVITAEEETIAVAGTFLALARDTAAVLAE
jgi:hypothetical protein